MINQVFVLSRPTRDLADSVRRAAGREGHRVDRQGLEALLGGRRSPPLLLFQSEDPELVRQIAALGRPDDVLLAHQAGDEEGAEPETQAVPAEEALHIAHRPISPSAVP